MKKILTVCVLLMACVPMHAQNGILNRAKKVVEKKSTEPTTDKKSTDTTVTKAPENTTTNTGNTANNNNNPSTPPSTDIKAYSKYDFVPGEKIIAFEDFSTGNIGDFPAGWNTSGSGEIVTIDGKPGRWLWITRPGVFVPEFLDKYPDDFTFEFDLLHGVPIKGADFHFTLAQLNNSSQPELYPYASNRYTIGLHTSNSDQKLGTTSSDSRKNTASQPGNQYNTDILSDKFNPVHISVWRQKDRVRIYCNQEKLWDIPKALASEAKLNAIIFSVTYADANIQHYISNLRLAVGAPDTRNKFLTENKWVTHGILFDVNSANIKPSSYGSLKEIANLLKEYPDLKVKIIGHTDADGTDAANLDLSKRRAEAVKLALAKEFAIDETRMQADGKGESEPISKNDTPAGKANNRRVEFIKL
jgi:OmpA-OmpF porin, OOP family